MIRVLKLIIDELQKIQKRFLSDNLHLKIKHELESSMTEVFTNRKQ